MKLLRRLSRQWVFAFEMLTLKRRMKNLIESQGRERNTLLATIDSLKRDKFDLEFAIRKNEEELAIANLNVANLTSVIERDRQRVLAEKAVAIAAQHTAENKR